jgi:hypothetical protein
MDRRGERREGKDSTGKHRRQRGKKRGGSPDAARSPPPPSEGSKTLDLNTLRPVLAPFASDSGKGAEEKIVPLLETL